MIDAALVAIVDRGREDRKLSPVQLSLGLTANWQVLERRGECSNFNSHRVEVTDIEHGMLVAPACRTVQPGYRAQKIMRWQAGNGVLLLLRCGGK